MLINLIRKNGIKSYGVDKYLQSTQKLFILKFPNTQLNELHENSICFRISSNSQRGKAHQLSPPAIHIHIQP